MHGMLMKELLENQAVEMFLTVVCTSIAGYISVKVMTWRKYEEVKQAELQNKQLEIEQRQKKMQDEARGNKRSSLRGEYLQIYLSNQFSTREKYEMTRPIIEEYTALNGNHYIHGLEKKMAEKLIEEEIEDETSK